MCHGIYRMVDAAGQFIIEATKRAGKKSGLARRIVAQKVEYFVYSDDKIVAALSFGNDGREKERDDRNNYLKDFVSEKSGRITQYSSE